MITPKLEVIGKYQFSVESKSKTCAFRDCWPSLSNQIKEGFKRLLCLVPYDIITPDVWSHIMPYWMECFRNEVPEEELSEMKILLSKVLDPDLSPLGFTTKQMYQFISLRLENTTPSVQEQALNWIQVLTMLEVPIPVKLLLTMLESAVQSLAKGRREKEAYSPIGKIFTHQASIKENLLQPKKSDTSQPEIKPEAAEVNEEESMINCYILILDILVKQMELQEIPTHKGLEDSQSQPILKLILNILRSPWPGTHTCDKINLIEVQGEVECRTQCAQCELVAIWYQLTLLLVDFLAPIVEITITDQIADPIGAGHLPAGPSQPQSEVTEGKTVWHTSHGDFEFEIEQLPVELQLLYDLLKKLDTDLKDADILYHLLGILKVLCLHAEVLNKAAQEPSRIPDLLQ